MDIRLFRSSGIFLLIVGTCILPPAALTPTAQAAFQRGFVYVGSTAIPGFQTTRGDRIFEVNPATGESRIFHEFPAEAAVLEAMTFTPAGNLRAVYGGNVLEFTPDGQRRTVYTALDLGGFPTGPNGMVYDRQGNFYVNTGASISRYPVDGGPAQFIAGAAQGVRSGPIAVDSAGNVFHANREQILRFSLTGERTVVDPMISTPTRPSMTIDDRDDLYITSIGDSPELDGYYAYRGGSLPERFLAPAFGGFTFAMTYSEVDQSLYVGSGGLYRLNRDSGQYAFLSFVGKDEIDSVGRGLAVYVPEPTSLFIAAIGVLIGSRRVTSSLLG